MAYNPSSFTAPKTVSVSKPYPTLNIITPEMFGAVHDGVTDDTAAINLAITSCITNKASLYLLGGSSKYYVNGAIDFSGTAGNLLVYGDGIFQSGIQLGTAG